MNLKQPVRVRITFQKRGSLRFLGHIDLQTLFERALRRSALPLRYSQGFRPKARLNLASALPLGFEGRAEVLDIWLNEPLDPDMIMQKLSQALPQELPLTEVKIVDNALPSLQASLKSAVYTVTLPEIICKDSRAAIDSALRQDSIVVERREKQIDMHPLIEEFEWLNACCFRLRLRSVPQETGRPDELLYYCGIDPAQTAIVREELIFQEE